MSEQGLRELFDRVIELSPEQRERFLAEACDTDIELRKEIEALLAADADAAQDPSWQHSALRNEVFAAGGHGPLGETIGQYRLVELIGRGGMGAVYRAERVDAAFEKCVAIKLIDGLFHTSSLIAHFRAERQILANLEHPNIARLLDGGATAAGLPYLVMEYVEGTSPSDFCNDHDLSLRERLALFRQICSAVHFAHQHMVIHRDLKPANILVMEDGTPKLLDFGIAKVLDPDPMNSAKDRTEPGTLKLTARYASPEQVLGKPVTTASDVYSLGVILYELLAGHSPYGDEDRAPHEIMRAVCDEEPSRPSTWNPKLKGDLDNVILHALRKQPLDRYSSVDQFSTDILAYLEGRPVQARGDAPLYVAAKFIRRNRVIVGAAALLLCALVIGLVEVNHARARANRRFNEVRQLAHSVMFDYADAIDRLPGATPVRARLVQDALTYLDSLSKEADTPQLQREIVDAYVRISNVQGNEYENNLGDTKASLTSAQKAVATAEKLLKRDRTLAALDSAASAFSTDGSLLYSTGELSAASSAYQRAISLREDIARQSPQDLSNQIALATCLNHMGDLTGGYGFQSLGKISDSLAYYERAKQLVMKLTAQFPGSIDVEKESYETLLSLSSSEGVVGKHEEAARDLDQAVTQIEKVSAAVPGDTNVKVELANAESRLGQVLLDGRQAAAAIPKFMRASDLLQELSRTDPGNAIFRRGRYVVEAQWAAALRGAGQPLVAVAHNREALQLAQALLQGSPASTQYRTDVGIGERKLSEGLLAAEDPAGALRSAEQAEQILCQGEAAPSNPNTLANCGRSELAAGNAYLALHDPKLAEPALRKAETIASQQSEGDPQNAVFRSDAARSQAALAAALAQAGKVESATQMYETALRTWSALRQTKAITAEDIHRSENAALALGGLRSRH